MKKMKFRLSLRSLVAIGLVFNCCIAQNGEAASDNAEICQILLRSLNPLSTITSALSNQCATINHADRVSAERYIDEWVTRCKGNPNCIVKAQRDGADWIDLLEKGKELRIPCCQAANDSSQLYRENLADWNARKCNSNDSEKKRSGGAR